MNKYYRLIFCIIFTHPLCSINAAKVDTVNIFSAGINGPAKCVVIKPASYSKQKKKKFPVVYLLHGYSGDYSNWITKVPDLKTYSDELDIIIVCPDGGYASWYFDSPVNPQSLYETYIAETVPAYIDSHYRTDTSKNARAITGLSMGGHGAIYIAWKHSKTFAAAGSMSGGVDLTESVNKFAIEKVIGEYSAENWKTFSVLTMPDTPAIRLQLIIDCGVDDFFIEGNRKLHNSLLSKKIPHEYVERPGNHSWNYWKYSIHFQLLFFKKFFDNTH